MQKIHKQSVRPPKGSLRLWNALAFLSLIVFVWILNDTLIHSNDTWWHIEIGRWMVENAQIIRTEVHSASITGKPFVAHEWLSQVLFYLMAGPQGVGLSYFKLVLMTLGSVAFGWALCRRHWTVAATYPILILLIYLMSFRAHVRPQLFGMWCTAALIIIWVRWQKTRNWRVFVWLLPLQIFWVNAHGSYLLAPCLLLFFAGSVWLSRAFKLLPADSHGQFTYRQAVEILCVALVLVLVSFVNPYGEQILLKSLSVFFKDAYMKTYIREWQSIATIEKGYWFYAWVVWWFFIGVAFWINRAKVTTVDAACAILAFAFPFTGVRYLTLSAMLSFPVLLKWVGGKGMPKLNPKMALLFVWPLILYVFMYGNPQNHDEYIGRGKGFNYKLVPLDILEHIRVHKLEGVMMNHYNDGAFVIYYSFPKVRTVMDSRTDLYGKERFEDHHHAFDDYESYTAYIRKHGVNLVMVRIANSGLRKFLYDDPQWRHIKTGMTHDLFQESLNNTLNRNEELKIQMGLLPTQNHLKYAKPLREEENMCVLARLYGYCPQLPECQKYCDWTDRKIARGMGLENEQCLAFLQACTKTESACNGCQAFCSVYRSGIPRLNEVLGTRLPRAVGCNESL